MLYADFRSGVEPLTRVVRPGGRTEGPALTGFDLRSRAFALSGLRTARYTKYTRTHTRRLENSMPFVKKEILDHLLTDEQDWEDLLAEREAAAWQLGKDAAKTSMRAEIAVAQMDKTDANNALDEAKREVKKYQSAFASEYEQRERLEKALAEQRERLEKALADERSNTDRNLRSQAMGEAIMLATMREGLDPLAAAKEFETFLRGEADPVHNDADRVDGLEESVRLVNSGWNSALEYVAAELNDSDSKLHQAAGDPLFMVSILNTMSREA